MPQVPEPSRQASGKKGRGGIGENARKKKEKKGLCVFVHSPYWFINDKLMT